MDMEGGGGEKERERIEDVGEVRGNEKCAGEEDEDEDEEVKGGRRRELGLGFEDLGALELGDDDDDVAEDDAGMVVAVVVVNTIWRMLEKRNAWEGGRGRQGAQVSPVSLWRSHARASG
ncbi:hypothetical protein F8388_013692 [Cannabis sativa]|uniref:Uncharacterized protein n=1 Tax=Cannabis sativa TaxID=3483 RepID=A0A7J6EKC1_CANSA|nr:hypothetical protein F8388_013692 [Cannabis sativa]